MTENVEILTNPPVTLSRHRVVVLAYDGLCTFEFGIAVEIFGLPRPEMGDAGTSSRSPPSMTVSCGLPAVSG
jgi:hypothetical protein